MRLHSLNRIDHESPQVATARAREASRVYGPSSAQATAELITAAEALAASGYVDEAISRLRVQLELSQNSDLQSLRRVAASLDACLAASARFEHESYLLRALTSDAELSDEELSSLDWARRVTGGLGILKFLIGNFQAGAEPSHSFAAFAVIYGTDLGHGAWTYGLARSSLYTTDTRRDPLGARRLEYAVDRANQHRDDVTVQGGSVHDGDGWLPRYRCAINEYMSAPALDSLDALIESALEVSTLLGGLLFNRTLAQDLTGLLMASIELIPERSRASVRVLYRRAIVGLLDSDVAYSVVVSRCREPEEHGVVGDSGARLVPTEQWPYVVAAPVKLLDLLSRESAISAEAEDEVMGHSTPKDRYSELAVTSVAGRARRASGTGHANPIMVLPNFDDLISAIEEYMDQVSIASDDIVRGELSAARARLEALEDWAQWRGWDFNEQAVRLRWMLAWIAFADGRLSEAVKYFVRELYPSRHGLTAVDSSVAIFRLSALGILGVAAPRSYTLSADRLELLSALAASYSESSLEHLVSTMTHAVVLSQQRPIDSIRYSRRFTALQRKFGFVNKNARLRVALLEAGCLHRLGRDRECGSICRRELDSAPGGSPELQAQTLWLELESLTNMGSIAGLDAALTDSRRIVGDPILQQSTSLALLLAMGRGHQIAGDISESLEVRMEVLERFRHLLGRRDLVHVLTLCAMQSEEVGDLIAASRWWAELSDFSERSANYYRQRVISGTERRDSTAR